MRHPPQEPFVNVSYAPRGYSLTELAIVLAIIGLVAGMTFSVGKVQMDVANSLSTTERLEIIRDALLLFHKKYERYPCPALPTDAPAHATYGREVAGGCAAICPAGLTCDNSAVIGVVPFKTLRINEEVAYDSWDAKITYAVDKNHTQTSTYNTGGILITDTIGNAITASPTLGDAIFVLASHGRDGKGAYAKSGTLIAACGAVGEDVENCNGDDTFTDSRLILSDNPAAYYDDLIAWQTQEQVNTESQEDEISPFIVAGWRHTCSTKSDGTAWCWGENTDGKLGNGNTTPQVAPVQVLTIANVRQMEIDDRHSCAVTENGTSWCWGDNNNAASGDGTPEFGKLGDGTSIDRTSPVQVSGLTNVRFISAGYPHSCAAKNDGTAWCWGENENGQLGDGTTTDSLVPVQVSGLTNVTSIIAGSGGDGFTCALKGDGTMWCWGRGANGRLGNGDTNPRFTPTQVSGLTGVTQFHAYGDHVCAVKNDGTVWCWGAGANGQIGDGVLGQRLLPSQVSNLTGATQVWTGHIHSCALKSDSTMWCWGGGANGRLGYGGTANRSTPVQVSGLTNVASITAGYFHSCAVKNDDTVWCWGGNSHGQLGDGTTTERHTPVQVLNFP